MFEDDVDDHGVDDINEEASALASAFQRDYEDDHSWEQLQEDEHGRLVAVDTGGARAKRRRLLDAAASARIRRGLIRYVTVVLDMSQAATITDMRGSRAAAMSTVAQRFIRDFFDQNPLSHLSLSLMRKGTAERLTELSGSPEAHVAKLKAQLDAEGSVSLQNALTLCMDALKSVPPYGHREVLILLAALSTCDPGNILDTIAAAKQAKVRVSVIGLAADVHICDKIAQETGGTYTVALNEQHLAELALRHSPPPPSRPSDASASLVRMGFPSRTPPSAGALVGEACERAPGGFVCPRCRGLVVDLPCSCHVCGLTLVSSPHLARSYHHLFPVPAYKEVTTEASPAADGRLEHDHVTQQICGPQYCFGCMRGFAEGEVSMIEDANAMVHFRSSCPQCRCTFCYDCDTFIHETLHNCPGCENGLATEHRTQQEAMGMEF